jgi:hypothetical protein
VRGQGSFVVVLQIVSCSGITALSGNQTPVTQSNARNISDNPKQKQTLKWAITALILMPTFCIYFYSFGILCSETCHTYQIQRSQVKCFALQQPHKLSYVRPTGADLAVRSTRLSSSIFRHAAAVRQGRWLKKSILDHSQSSSRDVAVR